MAWSFVGVSAAVTVTATAHALTEPAGVAPGDLLVAVISSRIASTTSITLPAGWTLVAESKTNNVVAAATTSEASGMMAYIVRGASAPALTFTHPTAPSVAMGRIVAYRGQRTDPFTVGIGAKTGTSITAVSTTGLTTTSANQLIVKGVCSGRAAAFSAHDAATDPTTGSGTGSVDTAAPTVGTWRERQDSSTTTGADTALAIADAIRGTAGATGALTCTASVSGGHAQVAGAFQIETGTATPGSSTITQTGSTTQYSLVSGNSGTVASNITVPSDADIVVVGVLGRDDVADYFASMTFTKGAADVAMTRVAPVGGAGGQQPAIFYLALPDKGTNKSLKFDWVGSAAPVAGTFPTISVTFWKGVDTASPVRSSGSQGEVAQRFFAETGTLTAQNGDLVVAMVGGYGPGSEGSIDAWYNLNAVTQWTVSGPHDAAWGSFAPSGNLAVGAYSATNLEYGVCAAIVLKPKTSPYTLVEFASTNGSSNFLSIGFADTQAGDIIVFAGGSFNSVAGIKVQTNFDDIGRFGTLGGVATPILTDNRYTFHGIIYPVGAGTSAVELTTTGSDHKQIAVWVLRNLGNPRQDKGVWTQNSPEPISVSGLTGTLADQYEFAISQALPPNQVFSVNTAQTGSAGFVLDALISTWDSGVSHQLTTDTASIQSAWNSSTGGADVLTATWYDVPTAATAGSSAIAQTGSTLNFGSSSANSGTVSSTITVPSDAEIVLVGVKGWTGAAEEPYFTNMTFTKGGADTPMTKVGTPDVTNGHRSSIFYLVLPDTGTNKTLKYDWAGTSAPGETPIISVTFWKGIDTASPIRSSGASPCAVVSSAFTCRTGPMAAQNGDRVVAFAGGDNPGSDGTVDTWLNLTTVSQCTKSADRHDAAWGTFAPTAELIVGATTATGMTYGCCAAIVLKSSSGVTGTLDVTDSPDTAFTTFTGTVENRGVLDVTDTADTAAFTGSVAWLAILDATDTADTAAFTGTVEWQGILFATDDPDTAAFTGTVENRGILDATDSPDIADFVGVVLIEVTGILDARDDPDTAAFTGDLTAYTEGILDATDLPDIADFTGTIFTDVTGVLTTTDIPDIAAFTGEIISSGILDATDLPDIVAFTGNIFDVVTGVLDATEDADTASFISDVTNFGILNVTDSPDIAAFTGEVITSGVLNATDTPDTADFTGTITAIVPFSQVCIIG